MNKKRFLLITLLFFFIIGARTSAQDFNNPRVHCLILDKTMSMTGHGGKDIWDDVKVYYYCPLKLKKSLITYPQCRLTSVADVFSK